VRAGPFPKVDQPIDHRFQTKPFGQRGAQQQPGVGDGVVVIERHAKGVRPVGGWHRESALLVGTDGRLSNAILPAQRAFLIIGARLYRRSHGGSRLTATWWRT